MVELPRTEYVDVPEFELSECPYMWAELDDFTEKRTRVNVLCVCADTQFYEETDFRQFIVVDEFWRVHATFTLWDSPVGGRWFDANGNRGGRVR